LVSAVLVVSAMRPPLQVLAAALLLLAVAMPVPAGAQRLEDSIRAQERWQRTWDRENDRRARDARDEARDQDHQRRKGDRNGAGIGEQHMVG
jgi:hypothetical protein